MAKSTLDADWASLKTILDYKSQQAGIGVRWTSISSSEAHHVVAF